MGVVARVGTNELRSLVQCTKTFMKEGLKVVIYVHPERDLEEQLILRGYLCLIVIVAYHQLPELGKEAL